MVKETQKSKIERLEREKTQLQEENDKLHTSLQEAWEKNIALQGTQDNAFLTSPAYRQLAEKIEMLERENAMLRRRLERAEKKISDQVALIEQPQTSMPEHNARGAGRKPGYKHDEAEFRALQAEGLSADEIMNRLQISRPTYYRYKKKYCRD